MIGDGNRQAPDGGNNFRGMRDLGLRDSFVTVVEVCDPSEIYVRCVKDTEQFTWLTKIIQTEHEGEGSSADVKDFRPVEGMVCIAKLRQDDGNYYRVRVQKFLKDIRKVRVYYLDTGMCHVLRSKDLQACREDYQRLPPMAVKVSLAEVDPVGGKK